MLMSGILFPYFKKNNLNSLLENVVLVNDDNIPLWLVSHLFLLEFFSLPTKELSLCAG